MLEGNETPQEISASISAMLSEATVDGEGEETTEGEVAEETQDEVDETVQNATQGKGDGTEGDSKSKEVPIDPRLEAMEQLIKKQEGIINKLIDGKKEPEVQEPDIDLDNLVTVEDYQKALEDFDSFKKLITNVAKTTHNYTVKHMYKALPGIVDVNVTRKVALSSAISTMLSANRDIAKHRKLLGITYQEIQAAHPELSPIEIIESHVAPRVRELLGLKGKETQKMPNKPANKTNVASGSSGRTGGPANKLSGIAAELDAMARV